MELQITIVTIIRIVHKYSFVYSLKYSTEANLLFIIWWFRVMTWGRHRDRNHWWTIKRSRMQRWKEHRYLYELEGLLLLNGGKIKRSISYCVYTTGLILSETVSFSYILSSYKTTTFKKVLSLVRFLKFSIGQPVKCPILAFPRLVQIIEFCKIVSLSWLRIRGMRALI